MDVAATVGVKAVEPGQRPDRRDLEEAARLLSSLGFKITRIGRFGVSVVCSQEDLARVLGVRLEPGTALSASTEPSDPELRRLLDTVEAVPQPEYF